MPVVNVRKIEHDAWDFLVGPPPGSPSDWLAHDSIRELADSVSRALGPAAPSASAWILLEEGWSATLWPESDRSRALEWLERFANNLPPGAQVQQVPRSRIPRQNDPVPTLTLGLAFTTVTSDLERQYRGASWLVDEQLTLALAEHAIEWLTLEEASVTYVSRGSWTARSLGLPPSLSLAQAAGAPRSSTTCQVHRKGPVRHRYVAFEREGRLSLQDVDRTRSASQQLSQLLKAACWEPETVDYGFVTYELGGHHDVWMGGYMHHDLPNGLREPDIRYHRPLLKSFVPDAFGVQVLSQDHLRRASDLSDWEVEEIADGRFLVSARDLDPWLQVPPPLPGDRFRLSAPPRSVLTQARADFGDMILTREAINRFDPL